MQNQQMMGVLEISGRCQLEQLLFNCQHGLAPGEAGAVGDTENVSINGDRRGSEGGVQDNVGCLAPHTGQGFEFCPGFRHPTIMDA